MKTSSWKKGLLVLGLGVVAGLTATLHHRNSATRAPANAALTDEYSTKIQPILDQRCVVCHSCYNAPCQLKLTAFEGVERGATKNLVYEPQRLHEAHPTRLFEDALTTADWQSRLGFFPVTPISDGDGHSSAMYRLLTHKQANPKATGFFAAEDNHSCPKNPDEINAYLNGKPEGGMPFGFPALSESENDTLTDWLDRGAPGPDAETLARLQRPSNGAAGEAVLARWETFLNQQDVKSRISARYIYEHLFLAHVSFDEIPNDFFSLVRSSTPSPQPVRAVATQRPYDDPKMQIYYRFHRISETIVRKTHTIYHVNDAKLRHFADLFINSNWGPGPIQFPSYAPAVASNPFISFKDIPARSRYQFLLDDAFYHVMTFIRGPVCKGNVALNVINAHFYIMFLNPDSDLTITHPDFLPRVANYLKLPAQGENNLIKAVYTRYKLDQLEYLKKRGALYSKFGSQGRTLSEIWDGGGSNDNAVLTVYRHLDSADVIRGAHGGTPKTAWVMDYPIFERIYYDLVAGFDVYGNARHQISTRMYMDNLRVESENQFLTFLPEAQRKPIRDSWYEGVYSDSIMHEYMDLVDPLDEKHIQTRIQYRDPAHSKEEFLSKVLDERFNATVRGPADTINAHDPDPMEGDARCGGRTEEDFARELAKVTKTPGEFPPLFPDVSMIRIRTSENDGIPYTMMHTNAFKNVRFLFEGIKAYDPRLPSEDDLQILRGFEGSYPNFFFDVPAEKLCDFLNTIKSLRSGDGSYRKLVDAFGVRRMDPRFWEVSDWFNQKYRQEKPVEAGVLDLTRYMNE